MDLGTGANEAVNAPVQIELLVGLQKNRVPAAYQFAGGSLVTDAWMTALSSYALDDTVSWSGDMRAPTVESLQSGTLTYSGMGWVGKAWRALECRWSAGGYFLRIRDVAAFWIAEDGRRLALAAAEENCPMELVHETALGAPLVLALALQGVFCLHASVVQAGDQLVAFAGESGQGKTTLARYLGFESGPGWRRIIDDTLPVKFNGSGELQALPHFPQLKLADNQQPIRLVPPAVPLGALYILNTDDQRLDNRVRTVPLARSSAVLAVIQHTVGARLFDRQLLVRHLAFCEMFSAKVPVRRLTYGRRLDCLPAVRTNLEEALGKR